MQGGCGRGARPRTTAPPDRLRRCGGPRPADPGPRGRRWWRRMVDVERRPPGVSFVDVLDRMLDKGVVIDAWVRVALVGIDLVTVEARVVVASTETYLTFAADLALAPSVARPAFAPYRAGPPCPVTGECQGRGAPNGRDP